LLRIVIGCARSGSRTARLILALTASAAVLLPTSVHAQRVLGGGSDAVTIPRGAFRVGIGGESTTQRDRWRDGVLEGLAGPITTDAFGALQFSMLASVEQLLTRVGVSDFDASLGSTRLDVRQRAFVTPLAIEYGLTDRITIGARATLVRTKSESLFRIRGDSGRATLGVNPYFLGSGVASQNTAVANAYGLAALNLYTRRDQCQANAAAYPECPTILAELASVTALAGRTSEFMQGVMYLYGLTGLPGRRFVPFVGSAADSTMRAHADSLRTALERYGVTNVTPATGVPAGAQIALAAADLDSLVRDSTSGYGARALNDAGLTQIGDVYVSALIKVFDTFGPDGAARYTSSGRGWRQSFLLEGRIGTSYHERADAFLDQGTGSGTSAMTVRSITDIVANQRLWATVAVGYTKAFAKDFEMRVPSEIGSEWLESWRTRIVPVTPGALLDVEISPRWHLNDRLAVGAQWRWRQKSADRHEYDQQFDILPEGRSVRLLGSLLDDRTAFSEQRAGISATFSTLSARARGRPDIPFEISYIHQQSIASGSGIVPKQWQDVLMIRYYARLRDR
jgi:hypothetical protein